MKLLTSVLVLLGSTAFAAGETESMVCSNADQSVKIIFHGIREQKPQEDRIDFKTLGLGGPLTTVLKGSDVKTVKSAEVLISSEENTTKTICNIPFKTVRRTFAQELRIAKKDGSVIVQDDTPSSDLYEIRTTVICSVSVSDAWPCPRNTRFP